MKEKELIKNLIDTEISKIENITPLEFATYVASEGEYDSIWDDIYNITKSLTDMNNTQ